MLSLKRKINKSEILEPLIIEDQRKGHSELEKLVSDGISKSTFFIPILTANSMKAQWVNQEIGFAYSKRQVEVLPIVQTSIISKLKGFVHDQKQIPYNFKAAKDAQHTSRNFRICADDLITYISSKVLKKFERAK